MYVLGSFSLLNWCEFSQLCAIFPDDYTVESDLEDCRDAEPLTKWCGGVQDPGVEAESGWIGSTLITPLIADIAVLFTPFWRA
jgi:hypothetical protein